jgi:Leucine-rich repeat (LRR) protein
VGSNVTILYIWNNQIASLEGLAGSNVTRLHINSNQVDSLEGLVGSNVTCLDITRNPCYKEFVELDRSIEKVIEKYNIPEIKDPGFC